MNALTTAGNASRLTTNDLWLVLIASCIVLAIITIGSVISAAAQRGPRPQPTHRVATGRKASR